MTIRMTGDEQLIAALNPSVLRDALQATVEAVAEIVVDRMEPYPSHTPRPQPFKSAKQRRAFFAKLRRGEIEVPYRRGSSPGSETLGRRWRVVPRSGIGAIAENTASYADLVHDAKKQSAYHAATGWQTDEGIADELEADGTAQRIATQAAMKALGL